MQADENRDKLSEIYHTSPCSCLMPRWDEGLASAGEAGERKCHQEGEPKALLRSSRSYLLQVAWDIELMYFCSALHINILLHNLFIQPY
jgi:hypothetical protein